MSERLPRSYPITVTISARPVLAHPQAQEEPMSDPKTTATRCLMNFGKCPANPGHKVMQDNDCFRCSSCGDTGGRACLCADCPARPENRRVIEELRKRDEERAEAALDLAADRG